MPLSTQPHLHVVQPHLKILKVFLISLSRLLLNDTKYRKVAGPLVRTTEAYHPIRYSLARELGTWTIIAALRQLSQTDIPYWVILSGSSMAGDHRGNKSAPLSLADVRGCGKLVGIMAKKKNKRRHISKQSSKQSAARPAAASPAAVATAKRPANSQPAGREESPAVPIAPPRVLTRADYALTDVKRIGVLAGACLVVLAVAWYVVNYTGVGTSIYSLIKI